jgi:predicted nicotinamide N-methyase
LNYPTCLYQFQNKLSILIPDPTTIKSSYDKLLQKDETTPFPYWAKLWPSAIALTNFLNKNIDLVTNKDIIEIGAGIGLPSLSIAKYARSVLITDHSLDAIDLLDKNITSLGLSNTKANYLDWNNFHNNLVYDLMLLSDVNYVPSNFEKLTKLIIENIENNKVVILATPQRITSGKFIESIQQYIIATNLETINQDEQEVQISISIFKKAI